MEEFILILPTLEKRKLSDGTIEYYWGVSEEEMMRAKNNPDAEVEALRKFCNQKATLLSILKSNTVVSKAKFDELEANFPIKVVFFRKTTFEIQVG